MQEHALSSEYIQTHEALFAFEKVLAKELTAAIAAAYTASLSAQLGGKDQPYETLCQQGNRVHEWVGRELYGPLIIGYCQWVEKQCQMINHTGIVHMALRDAAPMLAAAEVVWKKAELVPHGVYINRPILGIEDEIANDGSGADPHALEYLFQHGIRPNGKVVVCDSGAWGTVVKEMKMHLLPDTQFYPFFWYSHNPHIPGYINGLLTELGEDDSFGEIVNDSLECVFPQCFKRPTETVETQDGRIDVVLKANTALHVAWGESALVGVGKAAQYYQKGISHDEEKEALHVIILASLKAKQRSTWTGVLATHTPTWSAGQEFLSQWPEDLLP